MPQMELKLQVVLLSPEGSVGSIMLGPMKVKIKLTLELSIIAPSSCLFRIKQLMSVPSWKDIGKHAHLTHGYQMTWTQGCLADFNFPLKP